MASTVGVGQGDTAKVPVTIITGFLGAGKTTLLNYILKNKGNRNISVIENEFGEVNIDNELVADNLLEKEDLVSLDNGCVCCSLRKDVIKALAEIERRSRSRNRRLDAVILETTGLADPAPVAFTFFANPWIASRFRLDSILCVVDTRHIMQHLVMDEAGPDEGHVNETAQQLAFADLILLNKTDLVNQEGLDAVRAAVRRINQSAKLVESHPRQRPPLSDLLDSNAFSVNKALQVDPLFLDPDSGSECSSDGETGYSARQSQDEEEEGESEAGTSGRGQQEQQRQGWRHRLRQSGHKRSGSAEDSTSGSCAGKGEEGATASTGIDSSSQDRQPKRRRKRLHDLSGVGSVGIVAHGPLNEYRFNMFMRDLLAEKAKDIYRCKGVLAVHGYGNKRFVFQGVHETICYGPSERPWPDGEPMINQIVFIGKGLDRKALMEGFSTCVWQDLPEGWHEAQDPVTHQLYYYNTQTGQKQWARPGSVNAPPAAAGTAVTVTRLRSTEQPRSLQPHRHRASTANGC